METVCRHFIFLSPKDILPRITWIFALNWHNYFISVNLQYSIASCVSYPPSTKSLIWEVVNPRVPWSVLVKTLVGTGVETCTRSVITCETPAPCSKFKTCGAPVGGFVSSSGGSAHDADITHKINRCKQSQFVVSSFASPEYGYFLWLPASLSTGHD